MTTEEICNLLEKQFPQAVSRTELTARRPFAVVESSRLHEIAAFLRDDERMLFNMLQCITAIDLLEDNKLATIYDLFSVPVTGPGPCATIRHHFAIRVEVDRDDPHIPTVSDIWPAADWHEREAFDMMGIIFDGHPNLTRILCPDDWKGYPLRKDYEFPVEYHGIPATTEHQFTNPRH